jgi:hypothetical protein
MDLPTLEAKFIDVQVIDHDLMSSNDPMGRLTLSVAEIYDNPMTWAINKIF